jgi:hypothetical protein
MKIFSCRIPAPLREISYLGPKTQRKYVLSLLHASSLQKAYLLGYSFLENIFEYEDNGAILEPYG